jgi:CPA1 family monovalent cation:H+ antiporter
MTPEPQTTRRPADGTAMLDIIAVILVLAAAAAWLNRRYFGLPPTIGVMAIALVASLGIVGLERIGVTAPGMRERAFLESFDFSDVLMKGMLSVLLFAGALHVDLARLWRLARPIAILALVGTALSTLLVGMGCHWLSGLLGLDLPLIHCLLLGAIVSPTDPVAVLGILESAGVPHDVEGTIAGESLVNDGVGVVLYALLVDTLHSGHPPTLAEGVNLLVHEAVGGIVLGFIVGWSVNRLLASIDDYRVEVLITLATVVGAYAAAEHLATSGPLAMVVIGLLVGSEGRTLSMSETTRERLDLFWHLLDEILNAVLFVLVGLEFAVVRYPPGSARAAVGVVILSLLARFLIVGLPTLAFPAWFRLPPRAGWLLTWSGIRGGISVALALALPPGPERDTVLTLTYSVVVFSILVQGLTIGHLARRLGLTVS